MSKPTTYSSVPASPSSWASVAPAVPPLGARGVERSKAEPGGDCGADQRAVWTHGSPVFGGAHAERTMQHDRNISCQRIAGRLVGSTSASREGGPPASSVSCQSAGIDEPDRRDARRRGRRRRSRAGRRRRGSRPAPRRPPRPPPGRSPGAGFSTPHPRRVDDGRRRRRRWPGPPGRPRGGWWRWTRTPWARRRPGPPAPGRRTSSSKSKPSVPHAASGGVAVAPVGGDEHIGHLGAPLLVGEGAVVGPAHPVGVEGDGGEGALLEPEDGVGGEQVGAVPVADHAVHVDEQRRRAAHVAPRPRRRGRRSPTAASTPLTNFGESSVEKRVASSTASLITMPSGWSGSKASS